MDDKQIIAMIMAICELTDQPVQAAGAQLTYRECLNQVLRHRPLADDSYGDDRT